MTHNEELAKLLFGHVDKGVSEYEAKYPPRQLEQGARVTRFAPSPTGFMHIGNLFSAYAAKLTAGVSGGVFMLRIEDTDKKREVENGVSAIIDSLAQFNIFADEGVTGNDSEKGSYGPYQQSRRKHIYQAVAKQLVLDGMAYPCFCTAEQLDETRSEQERQGVNKGYYQQWAKCRELSLAEIKANIAAGMSYTLRFKSTGDENKKCFFDDVIKGKIEMPENVQDLVLLKTDGIPTYHFAHVVDDHFMRTTHVVRGDEWIASVPVHLALFKACGFKAVKYAHVAPIMKEENGGKRKLSKRKDPEAAVSFYAQAGYPSVCVTEYLLTLANSNFEEWRKANQSAPQSEFPFNLKKMSVSGALFDIAKLNDISKNIISQMPADEVFSQIKAWAQKYDQQLYSRFEQDESYAKAIFAIDRGTPKPRKDIACFSEVADYVSYFYDSTGFDYTLPENIDKALAIETLAAYQKIVNSSDDKTTWFEKIKAMCEQLGCTPNVKEYKKTPDAYRGHVGDITTIIRIAVTGRKNTPDLHAIIAVLKTEEVLSRLQRALENYGGH